MSYSSVLTMVSRRAVESTERTPLDRLEWSLTPLSLKTDTSNSSRVSRRDGEGMGSSSVERHHLAEYMAIRCCRAVVNAVEEIGVTVRADKLKWFEPNEAAAFLGVDSVRAGQVESLHRLLWMNETDGHLRLSSGPS